MFEVLTYEIETQGREKGLEGLVAVNHALLQVKNPDHPDAVFLIPNTEDNELSIFEGARELFVEDVCDNFLILDGAEDNGYPGYENWYNRFNQLVPGARIGMVPIADRRGVNTLSKFVALMPYAREKGIVSVYIVAAQFHQLRAFMTGASVALREYPELKIYVHPATEWPWDVVVTHSQGTKRGTRRELIGMEFDSISTYQNDAKIGVKPNSIEPTARILDYIKHL